MDSKLVVKRRLGGAPGPSQGQPRHNSIPDRLRNIGRTRTVGDESGQSLVVFSLMMVLFMGMLGIVFDYGYSNIMYRKMQIAADAAALAGAGELASEQPESVVLQRMQQILIANGADPQISSYTVDDNRTSVTAKTAVPTFFSSVFGIDEFMVAASAEAIYGLAPDSIDLMPFAVEKDTWVVGETVTLWGDSSGAGNFGWVRWTGQPPSTSNLRANIVDPSRSDELSIGDWVSGSPGVSFRAVQNSLNTWIGQEINVFLYDPAEVTGSGANLKYRVAGFARFIMTETEAHGRDSQIYGQFVGYVELGSDVDPSGEAGIKVVTLIQ